MAIPARLLQKRPNGHKRLNGRVPTITALVVGTAVIWACAPAQSLASSSPSSSDISTTTGQAQSTPVEAQPTYEISGQNEQPRPSEETVTLSGWMSIVWNDEPHYFLTADDGQTFEVVMDEQLIQPLGGPLALDRSRVIVLAVVNPDFPGIFQALSIEMEGSQ